jgi:hypothetical protein
MFLSAFSQKMDTTFLEKLLKSHPEYFEKVLNHPNKNEVQILYTQIDRDKNNKPLFRSYSYRLNPNWYFYPASTVKLPQAIFALEKINKLNIKGLTKESTMITDSDFAGQTKVTLDKSAKNGKPSIAHYIKKILLVSDNDAFNRLFEFVGRAETNEKLKANGLNDTRILNRLAIGDAGESAKHTNPISFYNGDKRVYQQKEQYDRKEYPLNLQNLVQGKAYIDSNEKLVNKPFSFDNKNAFSITDQQEVMKKLIFPEYYPLNKRFNLTKNDYKFIYKYMSMYPTESDFPKYDSKEFHATSSKFLFYGSDRNIKPEPNIRVFNKYGDSYGYIIDNSYFVDFDNKVEFLLTAVVQSNEDGIYNDGKYEYDTVCNPFMKNLGKVIYEHEMKRQKRHQPELSKFKINYSKN